MDDPKAEPQDFKFAGIIALLRVSTQHMVCEFGSPMTFKGFRVSVECGHIRSPQVFSNQAFKGNH